MVDEKLLSYQDIQGEAHTHIPARKSVIDAIMRALIDRLTIDPRCIGTSD